MKRMHTFLAASLRRRHRRCARDIATRMSRTLLRDTEDRTPDVSSRPRVSRWSGSQVRRSTKPAVVACSSAATGTVRPHHSEGSTIRALMDLAIPQFADLGEPHRPWVVTTDSPASPAPGCSTDLLRSPSPLLNLDALSSQQVREIRGRSSEFVMYLLMYRLWTFSQVGWAWDSQRTVWDAGHPKDIPDGRMPWSACVQALAMEVRADDKLLGLEAPGSPRKSEQTIYHRWGGGGWRQSDSLPLRIQGSCPLLRLRRLPMRTWWTHRCHCPPIVSRGGICKMFRMKVVCLTCRPLRQGF